MCLSNKEKMSIDPVKKKEFKVSLIGDVNVGKSTLAYRLHHDRPLLESAPTIASGFYKITKGDVTFNLFDTAGAERFRSLLPLYIRNSDVIIVVYDQSKISSLESLEPMINRFIHEIPDVAKSDWLLVGNKCDLVQPSDFSTAKIAQELVNSFNMDHVIVSAATGDHFEDLVSALLSILRERSKKTLDTDENIIKLSAAQDSEKNGEPQARKCCFLR